MTIGLLVAFQPAPMQTANALVPLCQLSLITLFIIHRFSKCLLLGMYRVALHQGSQKELRSVCFLEGGRPRRGDPAAPELAGEGSAAVSALRGVQVLAWRRARCGNGEVRGRQQGGVSVC